MSKLNILYAQLLPASSEIGEVAETKYPYHYVTENHLQAMWLEQKYFKNILTSKGECIEVISPGIWNCEAGPDFLKAHFRIGSKEVKGDVEIHLSDDGWSRHRHNQDPRYNGVVLHLSLWTPKTQHELEKMNGEKMHQAYFEPHLTISLNRILKLIDLELYPYKKFLGSGKCAHALFRKENSFDIQIFFYSAAEWRLVLKKQHLDAKIGDRKLIVGAGIAMALGYKENAEAFFEIFIRLMAAQPASEEISVALALGMCGFFHQPFKNKWKESQKYLELLNIFESQKFSHQVSLILGQIRPLNHPVRRLVYLSKLILDPNLFLLEEKIYVEWENNWQRFVQTGKWPQIQQLFIDLIPLYEDSFWNFHYTFIDKTRESVLPLLGGNIKKIIFVNTFLPLLQDSILERNDSKEIDAFHQLYRSVQGAKSGKMHYLRHRFFGDHQKGNVLNKASMEQGAFQLHKDFCSLYECSCEGCGFIEKYQSVFGVGDRHN